MHAVTREIKKGAIRSAFFHRWPLIRDVSAKPFFRQRLQAAVFLHIRNGAINRFQQVFITFAQRDAGLLAREGFTGDGKGVTGFLHQIQRCQAVNQDGVNSPYAQILVFRRVIIISPNVDALYVLAQPLRSWSPGRRQLSYLSGRLRF